MEKKDIKATPVKKTEVLDDKELEAVNGGVAQQGNPKVEDNQ